jgi:hypothetical protein
VIAQRPSAAIAYPARRPVRLGAAIISRRAKPYSKSRATPNPVNTPPNAADWSSTNTNWKAVYPGGKLKPGMLLTRERPPAKAVKKKSGNRIPGTSSAGVVYTLCRTRHATASATDQKLLVMSSSASSAWPRPRP